MKEIWYLWDGDTSRDMSFRERVTKIKFTDGDIMYSVAPAYKSHLGPFTLWEDFGADCTIVAYTFGETRERIKCECGNGKVTKSWFVGIGVSHSIKTCTACNGKGWVWV